MSHPIKVLYLEDDPHLGELTSSVLRKEFFDVEWVKNGQEGLRQLSIHHYDICVADIMMPRLDGYSFVKALREKKETIPVIFLSARVMTEDVLKGFETGGNDYMRKPFSVEELIVRMKNLLNRHGRLSFQSPAVSIGKYTFHTQTFELKINSKAVILPHRLGELLKQLVTSHDYTLDRKKALIEMWGEDTFFNGRSLDVFISRLRKSLSEDETIKIINIRGQGYKLIM